MIGYFVDSETALRFGLINEAVPTEQMEDRALDMAEQIAKKSPLTLAIGKEAFYRQGEMTLDEAYAYTAEVMVKNLEARDAQEGINAFIEKREPTWCGN